MADMTATAEPSAMEISSANTVTAAKRPRKAAKYVLGTVLALALIAATVHFGWVYSGSGGWELLQETNGTKLYALKYPGTSLVKYRSVSEVEVPLHNIVHFMQDPDACEDLRCRNSRTLEWVNPKVQYVAFVYGNQTGLFQFKPREYVVKVETMRDPAARNAVIVRYAGEPNRIAESECCVRVPLMNNSWRFTQLPGGKVQVEYTIDQYEGGFMPAFYANFKHKLTALRAPTRLPKLLTGEKYMQKYADRSLDFLDQ